MRADFDSTDGKLFIESVGKSAHGSTPQLGKCNRSDACFPMYFRIGRGPYGIFHNVLKQ